MVVLSPAMNLRDTGAQMSLTEPLFDDRARSIASLLREKDPWQLESLLGVNSKLALRAWDDYQAFGGEAGRLPAGRSFYGLAFQNLSLGDFTLDDAAYAQEHLRILSALYGYLRPDDGIYPYRLDFLCAFGRQGMEKGLYRYWGNSVCDALYRETDTAVNLCSGEYARLLEPYRKAGQRLVSCRFLENRTGKLRCLATASKIARGRMARYVLKNRLQQPEELRSFSWEGYRYEPALSGLEEYIFTR